MPVPVPPYRMPNTGSVSRKPSSSSVHSGVHSPARQSPDPLSNVQHRNLSPNSTGMLGAAGKYNGWPAWSPNASSDNLTNLNVGHRGYPAAEWEYDMANNPAREHPQLEIAPNHFPLRPTRQQQIAASQSAAISANPNAQDTRGRYPSTAPHNPAIQHPSFGSNASGYSSGLPAVPFDSIQPGDAEAELAGGMRSLTIEESVPRSVHNSSHARAVSYAGGLGGSEVQATGMPMPAPLTPTTSAQRSVSALHPQRSDPSIAQTYAYGQPTAADYGGYYPAVPGGNFSQYPFGPGADQLFGSPVISNASHRPSTYFYPPAQGIVYPSPQMGHTPVSGAMPSPVPTMARSKRDNQGAHFGSHRQSAQLTHPQRMLISAIAPGTGAMPVPSDPFSQYAISNQMFRLGQGINGLLPSQPAYGYHSTSARPVIGFVHSRQDTPLDPSATGRSPLLEQFRADKSKTWQLRDISGHVTEFCGDQHGSRFIQQKLETATEGEKETIFSELLPDGLFSLMTDVFGNYVIQKLFEFGSVEQRNVLVSVMEGRMLSLSLQMYGCRVVQKAIECIDSEQQAAFVREIDADVMRCVKDANGNHVIQKLIERVSPDLLGFVSAFQGNVYDLATHPYGCRVLQRCFEYLREPQTRPLIDELHKYTTQLMQDQFGNYVIQFVLEHGAPADREWILHKLRGQMVQMAKHKFASNVCEKALVTADSESRRLLIEEIMTPRPDAVNPIVLMMKDSFANYVLQRALQVVEGEQRLVLVTKVKPQLNNMRRYSSAYSKHLASIEKLLNERSNDESNLLRGLPSSDAPAHSTICSTLS
ncbi:Pumilio-family RNA binding repeat [Ceratobasidium sp. AG-Ba]|nr:Pumilio-family RNA binding repeat [Ceratobasidium sp. AG-Ba]QRW14369.1 Pumilio-family RNA binding repeat [Ceratobasidium sp. AG-Ba]